MRCVQNTLMTYNIRGVAFSRADFDSLPELINGWIGQNCEIHICHDLDLFVFSPYLSPEIFKQIKKHLQTRFEHEYEFSGQARLLSFYDIETSGLALIELAEAKLAKKKEAQKREEAQKYIVTKEEKRAVFLKSLPYPHLVSSLNKRRLARAILEILVVEDDPFSRKLISGVLTGHGVSFAEDGHKAVEVYLQKAPDIVFLDIDLPDVTGHDVLTKILSLDPDAYIVMLSGNSQGENVLTALKAGAKGFIGKPFTKEKLFQYIAKCSKHQYEPTGA